MALSNKSHSPLRTSLTVTTIYALITVILTYPVAFKISSVLAGFEGRDSLQDLWWLWWAKKALLDLHTSPANLVLLLHPTGGYHPTLAAASYLGLVSIPLMALFDPVVVFNLQFLLSFIVAGTAMYWLCLELTGNRWAAFIGGLIFAFFPSKSGHALGCHLDLITIYWFPIYALSLFKLVKRPSVRYATWCGVSLALSSLIALTHTAYFVVPFTATFALFLYYAARQQRLNPSFLRHALLGLLIAALLAGPFYLPLVAAKLTGTLFLVPFEGVGKSADLLAFLLPSPFHPLLSGSRLLPTFAYRIFRELSALQEHIAYLGIVPLLLAAWGTWKRRSASYLWIALGLGTAVLSLGNVLHFAGRTVTVEFGEVETYVLMPNALLSRLPLYALSRAPSRWNETTMFALAILASLGAATLLKGSMGRSRPARTTLVAALSLLIVVEYVAVFPFPVGELRVPDFVRQMAGDGDDRAVLNVPIVERRGSNRAMLYQTFHDHRIVGGYLLRYPQDDTGEPPMLTNFIAELMQPSLTPDIVDVPTPAQRRHFLHSLDIGRVIAYKPLLVSGQKGVAFVSLGLSPEEFQSATLSLLRETLGEPVFEDVENAIFTVIEGDQSVERLLLLKEGKWYKLERDDGLPKRWMKHTGTLMIYDPNGAQGSLRLTVSPYLWPRTLQVVVNDQVVERFGVPAQQTYTTGTFPLNEGFNVVRFEAPSGCDRAVDLSAGSDGVPRCLSFMFREIDFIAGGSPLAQHPASAILGDTVEFLGYDLDKDQAKAGDELGITLYWRTIQHMKKDYTIFLHLVDSQGHTVAQGDHQPLDGAYPTPRWPTGGVVGYRTQLAIPSELPTGEYRLKLGMYLVSTLERLPVVNDTSGESAIVLDTITIE